MDSRTDHPFSETRFQQLLQDFRQVHLESWDSQREDVLRRRKDVRAGFERRLRDRWGEALDEYEVIVEIALMMGWQFSQRWFLAARAARDYRTVSLIELHARCCRVAQEVLALLHAGFAPGAHARARTMHELAVVAFFIRDNPMEVARRYREYSMVERQRRAVEYNRTLPRTHADLGYEPIPEQEVRQLEEWVDRLKERYGADFVKGSYGWAAVLGKRRPTFRDLEESVNMGHLRPFYAWSSQDVHPGSHGNELSYLQRASGNLTLPAGASNAYLADPASGAMVSLYQATAALCLPLEEREYPEESCTVMEVHANRVAEVNALGELVDKAQRTFLKAHRQLEQDERRAWQEFQGELSD